MAVYSLITIMGKFFTSQYERDYVFHGTALKDLKGV